MIFRARSAPFCAHSRNLGTKVLLFFDICKHSALFLSFSLIFSLFCSFPRQLMPVVPFGGIFAVRFASPVFLFRPPLPSLCFLRPNLIRTSHPKHRPVFDASNADVAPSLAYMPDFLVVYCGAHFRLFTCGAISFFLLFTRDLYSVNAPRIYARHTFFIFFFLIFICISQIFVVPLQPQRFLQYI